VLTKLAGLGSVLGSSPTAEDLKAGRIPGKRLEVELESGETPQAVERALSQISDLASVAVRGTAEAPAPPAPPAAPGPPPTAAEGPRTVRVRTELLDYFLDTVGELILATARLREVGRALAQPHRRGHEEEDRPTPSSRSCTARSWCGDPIAVAVTGRCGGSDLARKTASGRGGGDWGGDRSTGPSRRSCDPLLHWSAMP
jgi:chemotaxis protein histidine kinase CheA